MYNHIHYKFVKTSTASEVLSGTNLRGRLVVLTGATSGIGIITAEAMARTGADLVIGARNPAKLDNLLTRLQTSCPNAKIYGFSLDLMSIDSVDAFADAVLELDRPIDTLINNAGSICNELIRNEAGVESHLMTNFVGHALLTSRLSHSLQRAKRSRVISVSSVGHQFSPVIFDDLNFERRPFQVWEAYGQSKTANVLLAVKIANELVAGGIDAFAVHPGSIRTEISKGLSSKDLEQAVALGPPPEVKTLEQGAATTVWAATEGQLTGLSPLYLENCHIAEVLEKPTHAHGVMSYALSPSNADRLWLATEQLIDRRLPL